MRGRTVDTTGVGHFVTNAAIGFGTGRGDIGGHRGLPRTQRRLDFGIAGARGKVGGDGGGGGAESAGDA